MGSEIDTTNWQRLLVLAGQQAGHFSLRQADEVGVSKQLVRWHFGQGHLTRPLRGVYRLVDAPEVVNQHWWALWIWTDRRGVFTGNSAMWLQGLADRRPVRTTLALPTAMRRRTMATPQWVSLEFRDIPAERVVLADGLPVERVESLQILRLPKRPITNYKP